MQADEFDCVRFFTDPKQMNREEMVPSVMVLCCRSRLENQGEEKFLHTGARGEDKDLPHAALLW